jgi:ubiquinone/menaquinone biosynthesis C-methylase UbiE
MRESDNAVKQCCAQLYESDLARYLLGDSFHPGGLALTRRLGELLHLGPQSRVLDVACGKGVSAAYLTEHFGCEVVGVDYSEQNVTQANRLAETKRLARFSCERADAEKLPFPDNSFDAVICECAFCTFPDKSAAARELARVVRPGGSVGLSDLTRSAALPRELDGLLAHITCIADAQPIERYQAYLCGAGFATSATEKHDEALREMVQQIRGKLLAAEVMIGLKKLELPGIDFAAAKQIATSAREAIRRGQLGYAVMTAIKPAPEQSPIAI